VLPLLRCVAAGVLCRAFRKQKDPAVPMGSASATLSTYDDSSEGVEGLQVDQYEHPSHLRAFASADITDVQRAKLRDTFSIDEEYYQLAGFDVQEPSSKKRPQATDEDSGDSDEGEEEEEQRVAAQPPAPAPEKPSPKAEDPSVEQVPPVLPVFHSYDASVRQIQQNVLPPTPTAGAGCPAAFALTNVLAYGPASVAGQPFHNWPGY
jgi:pyruvate/2-oxoglutarate dehydrogenase complex dihydrolipoamide acyltransferase (E2) component